MEQVLYSHLPDGISNEARIQVGKFLAQHEAVNIKDINLECHSWDEFENKLIPLFDSVAIRLLDYLDVGDHEQLLFTNNIKFNDTIIGRHTLYYHIDADFEFMVAYHTYNDHDNFICNVIILAKPYYWPEKAEQLSKALAPFKTCDHTKATNQVWALKQTPTGFTTSSIGEMHDKLVYENYSDIVNKKLEHLIEDLQNDEPCGKLNIINGEPGTGKTRLVRGLISTLTDVDFILMAPDQITSLNSTGIIEALLQHKIEQENPICLVLEDADHCLVERMSDNMSSLSTLLNSSDGIVGSLLDLRIIATTNSSHVEFDKAILRPGRLCTHVQIGPLSEVQAQSRYNELTENKGPFKFIKAATIAEIYKYAYDFKHEQEELN